MKILLLLFIFLSINNVYGASGITIELTPDEKILEPIDKDFCDYTEEYLSCMKGTSNERYSICELKEKEGVDTMFQIILDKKFGEVDKDSEKYLEELKNNKEKYFGKDAELNFFDALIDIESTFGKYGTFYRKYEGLCKTEIITEALMCFEGGISINKADSYINKQGPNKCMELANKKLKIYTQVSHNILQLNKAEARRENKISHMKKQREKYDGLLNQLMYGIGFLERIWQKWPQKTKKAE